MQSQLRRRKATALSHASQPLLPSLNPHAVCSQFELTQGDSDAGAVSSLSLRPKQGINPQMFDLLVLELSADAIRCRQSICCSRLI